MSTPLITLPIIGFVRSPLKQKFGTPRQPNLVNISATIKMLPPFDDIQAFDGIEQFSHLWILWQFHQNRINDNTKNFRPTVRPPRLGGNQKLGVFATRSMYRPANIGLSVVQFSHIEKTDNSLFIHIRGVDMIDGTPVIDIKPYIAYSDSIVDAVSGYAEDMPSIKQVSWEPNLSSSLPSLLEQHYLSENDLQIIEQLIAQDPRPAYRQQEFGSEFIMRYGYMDVFFRQIEENSLEIYDLKNIH